MKKKMERLEKHINFMETLLRKGFIEKSKMYVQSVKYLGCHLYYKLLIYCSMHLDSFIILFKIHTSIIKG